MKSIILNHNYKNLTPKNDNADCNSICRVKNSCLLEIKYLLSQLIYQADVRNNEFKYCLKSWTKYLRQTLVFMSNMSLWSNFNFYFLTVLW